MQITETTKRTKKSYEPEFSLRVAREVEANGVDIHKVALKHQLPFSTAENWYLRYKAYGEKHFTERAAKKVNRGDMLTDLMTRVARLEREFGLTN